MNELESVRDAQATLDSTHAIPAATAVFKSPQVPPFGQSQNRIERFGRHRPTRDRGKYSLFRISDTLSRWCSNPLSQKIVPMANDTRFL